MVDSITQNGGSRKRKVASGEADGNAPKRSKGKKKWDMPRVNQNEDRIISPGDAGIWATCARGKEAPSVGDLRHLFEEYASEVYGSNPASNGAEPKDAEADEDEADIEAEIQREIDEIRKPSVEPLFKSVKLDSGSLLFFKTRDPVDPVAFVHKLCRDTANGRQLRRCRFVKRLTPVTAIDKATERGLEDVARKVLASHFHGEEQTEKKFAIRVTTRNNKQLSRDYVIKTVASLVGQQHRVDLNGYDLLILVEIYQNIVGMSVVNSEFDELKRFNLEELSSIKAPAEQLDKPEKTEQSADGET